MTFDARRSPSANPFNLKECGADPMPQSASTPRDAHLSTPPLESKVQTYKCVCVLDMVLRGFDSQRWAIILAPMSQTI